jgi:hypothetical protein
VKGQYKFISLETALKLGFFLDQWDDPDNDETDLLYHIENFEIIEFLREIVREHS